MRTGMGRQEEAVQQIAESLKKDERVEAVFLKVHGKRRA